jgi:hypothetical protein
VVKPAVNRADVIAGTRSLARRSGYAPSKKGG